MHLHDAAIKQLDFVSLDGPDLLKTFNQLDQVVQLEVTVIAYSMFFRVTLRQLPSDVAADHADGLGTAFTVANRVAFELDLVREGSVAQHALSHTRFALLLDCSKVDCFR